MSKLGLKVGEIVNLHGGQPYVCDDVFEYEIHRWVDMYSLTGRCVDCHAPFRTMATLSRIKRQNGEGVTQRCERCRRPGIPVRRRKAAAPSPEKKAADRVAKIGRKPAKVKRTAKYKAVHLGTAVGAAMPPEVESGAAAAAMPRTDTYSAALNLLD